MSTANTTVTVTIAVISITIVVFIVGICQRKRSKKPGIHPK